MEEARRRIAKTEEPLPLTQTGWKAGTRVMHQILGEGTVLAPGEGGIIIQFDRFVTPRTIAEKMLTVL